MRAAAYDRTMSTPRVTITGFRPFPGVPVNPSALLVEALEREAAWPSATKAQAHFHLLDTHYRSVGDGIAALLDNAPDALVMTGYSRHATGLVLETRATDHCLPDRPDQSGWCPPVAETDPRLRDNHAVDFSALIGALAAEGLAAELSSDAGSYVCNHAYWHALEIIAQRQLPTRAIFVHLPALEGMDEAPECSGAMTLEAMQRGIGLVVRGLFWDFEFLPAGAQVDEVHPGGGACAARRDSKGLSTGQRAGLRRNKSTGEASHPAACRKMECYARVLHALARQA